ncbi:MAG: thioredoxin fold domain-containing protein [Balneolales bacterium]
MNPQTFFYCHISQRVFRKISRNALSLILSVILLGALVSITAVKGASDEDENDERNDAVVWHTFDEAQQKAAGEPKPLFIFVEADWCLPCKRMKRNVFSRKEISRLLNELYYAVSIDVDSRQKLTFRGTSLSERSFARQMEVTTTPTMIFLVPDGTELGRRPGALERDELATLLQYVDSDHFGNISLDEFEKKELP